ncbi:transcriptional regulator [Pseudescherichia vulneris]|nr:transcriptional regulator [Pseudescherichia vulneris]
MNDIQAFLAVAKEKSFTRAAARLRVSPSALSHTLKNLEARLGVRLLTRTTRNVAPTEAGERLMQSVGPLFEQINAEIDKIGELRTNLPGRSGSPAPMTPQNNFSAQHCPRFSKRIPRLTSKLPSITGLPILLSSASMPGSGWVSPSVRI